jgi:hypothetical protein
MKNCTDSAVNRLPTHEQIAKRAYQICLERGSQPGYEIDDWLQAEYELMQLPVRKIAELEPSKRKNGSKMLLVSLVQAAVLLGAKALPHLKQ